jgi:hypothetical protein
MSKEWILNAATNRFQLNFKRNVGAVAEEIRKCEPKTLDDWQKYYFGQVYSEEHLRELGQKLYVRVTEVIQSEVEAISEDDCIQYIRNLVIERTFAGYQTEKTTIYEQLQQLLGIEIEAAPDKWDRLFNVDFFIQIGQRFIGLQIKPVTFYNANEHYKWRDVQRDTHEKFAQQFGGKVFTIVSMKQGDAKRIANPQVVAEIQAEMTRLSQVAE